MAIPSVLPARCQSLSSLGGFTPHLPQERAKCQGCHWVCFLVQRCSSGAWFLLPVESALFLVPKTCLLSSELAKGF